MRIALSACKPAEPLLSFTTGAGGFNMGTCNFNPRNWKEKVVIVIGATGTGKSRLSIDLATRFSAEVVNSDKMQAYRGLDIATNKVTADECRGVPHHLLGFVDPNADFSAAEFRRHASLAVDSIAARERLPIIAGGSNSYVEALVNDDLEFRSKYEFCFLCVYVALPVLYSFVSNRVDRMVQSGLVDEVRGMFDPEADYTRGIRRAIGVPELDPFFRAEGSAAEETRAKLLQDAIREIKENNCKLAYRQLHKIRRLDNLLGHKMHRLDATDVFLKRGVEAAEAWERLILRPSTAILNRFLSGESSFLSHEDCLATALVPPMAAPAAVAATFG
ncbi:adenylate isopentenyltransferase 5, chloroplastic-like [Malania oleifera]|uniref:adenylate isopentenyltransferase 5, chloroplastic-like n=1 Tax=Malania oleifera TaxID=397392 RepID=UPI0025ADEF84|nr:adenylate isopentenyltransferase 5, chloroplastic-like [Malania oleifera]XP_057956792.1 adenylate isopentenyltransferase 5, chloroplastic-like [Malania oleifera]